MPPAGVRSTKDESATVAAFLRQVDVWRGRLAVDAPPQHPHDNRREFAAIIAHTLEGLVYLLLCEQRGLESPGQLIALAGANDTHRRLIDLFHTADARYCRSRPHFAASNTRDYGAGRLDDVLLQQTIAALCTREGADMLPAETLARVHEQSIGAAPHVAPQGRIRATYTRRKTHGIYYTPTRLIDHVVQRTLDQAQSERDRPPRIVDPACGAGVFLLGAFQYLLDRQRADHLTIHDRQRILHDSTFGVELDARATETTRLALLLKLFEDGADPNGAPLPDLSTNIRCGNALVGPAIGCPAQPADSDGFDWAAAFPAVFAGANPGFDAVIGNPPWGQKAIEKNRQLIAYLRSKFPSIRGIFDLFRPFVEQAVRLACPGGAVGLVLPDIVLLKNYEATRRYLLEHLTLTALDWWGMRFGDALIDVATIVGTTKPAPLDHEVQIGIRPEIRPGGTSGNGEKSYPLPQADFLTNARCTFNLHLTPEKRSQLQQLDAFPRLEEFFEVHEGVHSGNVRAELFVGRRLDESCRPLLFGRDELAPYHLGWRGQYIRLSAAPQSRSRPGRYANTGRPEWFNRQKLLIRRTSDRVVAAIDREQRYASNNFFVVFPRTDGPLSLDGLCALLNSGFMTWFFRTIEPRQGRIFAELKIKHISTFPLPDPRQHADDCDALNELGRERATLAGEPTSTRAEAVDARIDAITREVFGIDANPHDQSRPRREY